MPTGTEIIRTPQEKDKGNTVEDDDMVSLCNHDKF